MILWTIKGNVDDDNALVASVFPKDMERSLRISRRLQSGMVLVNNYHRKILDLPFVGVKGSGYGREHNIETLHEWTRAKFIQIPSGRGTIPDWWAIEPCFGNMTIDGGNGV